ncbi:MAG: HD domain-containing protein [Opitutales bacterium]|nr:HD domain-containing protein [Opitutales bacterium]
MSDQTQDFASSLNDWQNERLKPVPEKIADLKNLREEDGKRTFVALAVLRSCQIKLTKTGNEFLLLEFGDNTGSFSTMCFDGSPVFDEFRDAIAGSAYEVHGITDFYQGRFSPKIDSARLIEGEELDAIVEYLAPVSPHNPDEMQTELFAFIERIEDEALRETVLYAINDVGDVFFKSTAAVKMHHAYVFGLLEHSLKTARMASALLPLYPFIDADLAIAGCILHDIGKVIEYSQGLAPDRTKIGVLQGHVVLGYRIVRKAGLKVGLNKELLMRLEHIILSHQGEPEWGAAVRAATPEAIFVSTIDNFDAKMGALDASLRSAGDAEFVDVGALKTKVLTEKPIH